MDNSTDILKYYIKKKRSMGYFADAYLYWYGKRITPQCYLETWYLEAKHLWKLSCSYEDFSWLVENETTNLYYKYHSYQARKRKSRPLNENDRGPRPKPNYKKKELSEEDKRKREWRKKKKDRRDQGSRFHQRKAWTFLQKVGNRSERRKVKSKMKSTKWQAYGPRIDQMSEDEWGIVTFDTFYCENEYDTWLHPDKREHFNHWDYY